MKFAIIAALALVNAQDEEAPAEGEAAAEEAPKIAAGEDCKENPTGCDAGLCCAEAVFKEDVVEGEVAENYLDNMKTVCNGEKETEWTDADEQGYWTTCLKVAGAEKLAAVATAALATAYFM